MFQRPPGVEVTKKRTEASQRLPTGPLHFFNPFNLGSVPGLAEAGKKSVE